MDRRFNGKGRAGLPRCGFGHETEHVEASAEVVHSVGALAVGRYRCAEALRLETAGQRQRRGRLHQGIDRSTAGSPPDQRRQDADGDPIQVETARLLPLPETAP